jgi:hypothetical protein
MVGLFVVFGCGNRCVPELVLIPMSPWLTGYWALLILQVAGLLGYTASQGYLPAFATSTSTPRTRGGWPTHLTLSDLGECSRLGIEDAAQPLDGALDAFGELGVGFPSQ